MVELKKLLDNIGVICISKSDDAVFEKGEPERVVTLTDVLNILHDFDEEFKNWRVVK